jgi:asparagine synthetase B (glutamine-hydrolysing)
MIVGGFGPGARTLVERVVGGVGAKIWSEGLLTVAGLSGGVGHAVSGETHAWVAGRISGGPSVSAAAAAAAASLDRRGDEARRTLHGAYVLVTLNVERGLIGLSRDHLGARTLAYARSGPNMLFAEHIADLLTLLPSTPPPDRQTVVNWLERRSVPLGRSLFTGIAQVPPGHLLELGPRHTVLREFWLPRYREPLAKDRDEAAALVTAAAFAAVTRSVADLSHVGLRLSGGIDSACVAAALAADPAPRQVTAFARTFPDYPDTDESALITDTARVTGIPVVAMPYSDTPVFPRALDYIERWRLPPGSPNGAIWRALMAEASVVGVDGMLDGEGGDERFGLAPYLIADRLRSGRFLSAWRLTSGIPGVGPNASSRMRWRGVRVYGVTGAVPPYAHNVRRRLRGRRAGVSRLVLDRDLQELSLADEEWAWKALGGPVWWRNVVDSAVNGGDRMDANGEMSRDAVDCGFDRRHPFLHDVALLEAVLDIRPDEQFDAVRDRPLLRDGLRGLVPETVRTRHTKSFFTELSTRLLAGAEGAALLNAVMQPDAPIREFVNVAGLEDLRTIRTARGPARHRTAAVLFRVATMDAWLRRLDGRPWP